MIHLAGIVFVNSFKIFLYQDVQIQKLPMGDLKVDPLKIYEID